MESRLQESGGAYEKGEQEEEVNYESRIQNIRQISRQEFKERIDIEYGKLEQELMNDEITPDEHVERYNALMELEPQSFGPPELHEHI